MSEGIGNPKECVAADEERAPRKCSQRSGIFSRMWRGIFRLRSEDYEKKLQHLSKEEAAVQTRMKMRVLSTRKRARNLIMFSATFEVVAVAFAVIAIRSLNFTGPMKFARTLPAILLPFLSYVVHLAHQSLTRMLDHMDQKTLEKLRAERKAKIDELKERTNYYTTQQLIQRYDLDPAAKLAAATVLASRLGTESSLKVHITDNPTTIIEETKSDAIKQANTTAHRHPKLPVAQLPEFSGDVGANHLPDTAVSPTPLVVQHYGGLGTSDGGWIARIAALLVGDSPLQCNALICGNCHRHNGLVRKEDFPYVSYYCPHCGALNTSKQKVEQESRKICTTSEGVFARNGSNGKLETSTGEESVAPESIPELPESAAD